jgi:hypothetical protein
MSADLSAQKALAWEHVAKGRAIVEKQRTLIDHIRAQGHNSGQAEGLLAQFEQTLVIFEQDLADLTKRG